MKVEIFIDNACTERKVVIYADKLDDEVNEIYSRLSKQPNTTDTLTVFDESGAVFVETDSILRVYSQGGKVFVCTADGTYQVRARMYELEQSLDARRFARISNSEIINLRQVKRMDTSMTGTICVTMKDGSQTYASRRYVAQIRRLLDI